MNAHAFRLLCGPWNRGTAESLCIHKNRPLSTNRVSGPLLDRIDLHVEVPTVKLRDIAAERTGESAAQIRERVLAAGAFSRSGSKVGRRSPATPGWDRGD